MKDLRKHQLRCAKALENVAEMCDRYKIRYFLLAGSCLGAVRHSGFIPWDDDIDIGIFNEDYDKFEKHILSCLPEGYTWISNDKTSNYPRFYGKVLYDGVACIDVFRIVRLPAEKKYQKKMWMVRKLLYKIYSRKFNRIFDDETKLNYIVSKVISLFISKKQIVKIAKWNEMRFQKYPSRDYINLYSIYHMDKETIRAEWLSGESIVTFEGKQYKTVSNTHEYLTHLYGDYMKPPDKKTRQLRHIDVHFGSE